ncbi:LacI family DNA-binding transcriptional regulator [Streptomyces luomodiensis]|uniref:LacI family DNA-binding transcriptional regulator n=1 Tax=Streptomyces luomodiensis TaxID=3026192 RepID=UPI00287B7E73|nr:LacI family DNA-binding transcriptional regulator [Streptomyces sp. SCA4-21]
MAGEPRTAPRRVRLVPEAVTRGYGGCRGSEVTLPGSYDRVSAYVKREESVGSARGTAPLGRNPRGSDHGANRPGRGSGRPTIKDVAARANVSPMTASRVVNGHPRVRADLRERVLAAVAELGYARNAVATSLRRPDLSPWTIGLILHDVGNPFSAAIHRAVEDVVRSVGSFVLTASTDEDHERMGLLLDAFRDRDVDGLLLAPPPGDQSYLTPHLRRGMALVLVDRPAEGLDAPAVLSDNESGMRQAVRHLLDHGHRHIAYLGDLRSAPMRLRFAGYQAALAEAGLTPDPGLLHHTVEDTEAAAHITERIANGSGRATAVIAARNALSIGAVRGLRRAGAQHRIALLGFDDVELAGELEPGLTVVAQDPAAIGTAAATALIEQLADPSRAITGRLLPPRLIPRGSGELPPYRPAG